MNLNPCTTPEEHPSHTDGATAVGSALVHWLRSAPWTLRLRSARGVCWPHFPGGNCEASTKGPTSGHVEEKRGDWQVYRTRHMSRTLPDGVPVHGLTLRRAAAHAAARAARPRPCSAVLLSAHLLHPAAACPPRCLYRTTPHGTTPRCPCCPRCAVSHHPAAATVSHAAPSHPARPCCPYNTVPRSTLHHTVPRWPVRRHVLRLSAVSSPARRVTVSCCSRAELTTLLCTPSRSRAPRRATHGTAPTTA